MIRKQKLLTWCGSSANGGDRKGAFKKAKILILDEPSAALTENEVETLMDILRKLKNDGVTCIYISHKINEIFEIADTVTILRDGETIGTKPIDQTTENEVIAMMVGRELSNRFPRIDHETGEVIFEVKNYNVFDPDNPQRKLVDNASFNVRRGEILGIAGLMGAGRTELMSSIFGGFPGESYGEVYINGQKVEIKSPQDAINNGLAMVTEDRKRYGLVLIHDVKKNLTLANLKQYCKSGIINSNEEIHDSQSIVDSLSIKTPSLETKS